MKSLATSALFLFIHSLAFGTTINVPDDFPTIQEAVNAAASGDCIVVRPGTYEENIDINLKSISLISEQGPQITFIRGNRSRSVLKITGQVYSPVVIDGFTITDGYAKWDSGNYYGGGIYCFESLPIIVNNRIIYNWADSYDGSPPTGGGGICCANCVGVVISSNVIANNQLVPSDPHGAMGSGGGLIVSECHSATITGNLIKKNIAGDYGAGLVCSESTATVEGNIITGNEVGGFPGDACTGGGVYCHKGSTTLVNNLIIYNEAMFFGGGIAGYEADMLLVNNTIAFNQADIEHGGLSYMGGSDSNVEMVNTIFWSNEGSNANNEIGINGTGSISFSDVEGGLAAVDIEPGSNFGWGSGMIDADPVFADPYKADFHLTWNSPCVDAGEIYPPCDPLTDIEGDDRYTYQLNTEQDIGADEYFCHLYHRGDIIPGSSIELKFVGWPAEPVTLALSNSLLDPPAWTPHGKLYVGWPPLWSATVGDIPGDGILTVPVTVPFAWISGEEYYLQALIGSWGGQPAWMTNAETLLVE